MSTKIQPVFAPGDIVRYPGHGIGTIRCVHEKEAIGMFVPCYQVTFNSTDVVDVAVTVGNRKFVRYTPNGIGINEVARWLREEPAPLGGNWNKIETKYMQLLRRGAPRDLAVVVRDLYPHIALGKTGIQSLYRSGLGQLVSLLQQPDMTRLMLLTQLSEMTSMHFKPVDDEPRPYVSTSAIHKSHVR